MGYLVLKVKSWEKFTKSSSGHDWPLFLHLVQITIVAARLMILDFHECDKSKMVLKP